MDAFIYCADIYCEDCGRELRRECRSVPKDARDDSDSYPQGPCPDGGGEADCPQHCGNCRVFLENPLTADGVEYVREKLIEGTGDPDILDEWAKFYDIDVSAEVD